ncbi:cytochrome bd ubiquinol oxidase subunit I [Alicyclobacillus hesperidum URH17-3-68]|uniref:Cytochrome bd ubiquinol oxidase subunit 1 n=1 Tax=Alicyclobacillus hesperidum TaxID=89784 RepID=A0AA37TYD6_9BACL|nr:cytochrome ubiquinol oxidase subunit I [Alicyclobacillus hesperidum]EJY56372.1 cytochrome bd ubiquinol oxidase subunit I [Alicyclobacillus hesperidum URH17-3-68]GLV14971.1 cytochrome bd ubiquinol oxidase subunit 1 [Alicyclobacillus hesperidum]
MPSEVALARWQFGITTIYHFFFVPVTIGMVFLIAIMETFYVVKKDDNYKRMAQFWGKIFLINFAVGVVTGILQEFQFGMNWANYSRFVGDVFGAPLAIESLLAFFLESTFLGVWMFGWDKLSKRMHVASIWLVAIGTTLSAFWILTANAFMQHPVGYILKDGHAEMSDFGALITNRQLWYEFPHVFLGALVTGAFVVAGISAYQLLRKRYVEVFKPSFTIASIVGMAASFLVMVVGHEQAQYLVVSQPMKLAASEALWTTSGNPAPWTLFTIIHPAEHKNTFVLQVPYLLSILSYNRLHGAVTGLLELQKQMQAKYGPGNYIPDVIVTFWGFRVMVLAGVLMFAASAWGVWMVVRERLLESRRYLKLMFASISLPFVANTAGWLMTEMGRQPWVVYGLQLTRDGVSPTVSPDEVLLTLISFTVLYGLLAVVDLFLIARAVKQGPDHGEHGDEPESLSTLAL